MTRAQTDALSCPLTAISCHRHVIIAPDKMVTYFYTKQMFGVYIEIRCILVLMKQSFFVGVITEFNLLFQALFLLYSFDNKK